MPEQELNIEQLLQDYVRDRDAMVERGARRHVPDPARLLAAIRETSRANALLANRFATTAPSHWIPNAEAFISREHCLVINVELAGMRREDLEITIDANRLMISGQRPEREQSSSESSLLLRDIHYGPFECVIEIPAGYDLSRAKAAYQNGFLRVEVPKAQPASLSPTSGIDVEKVLRNYVQDRDRVAAKVVLKPGDVDFAPPEIAPVRIANAPRESVPRRWWNAVRRAIFATGRAPKQDTPSPVKEVTRSESRQPMAESLSAYHPDRSVQPALPEMADERELGLTMFNRAMTKLAQEFATAGKTEVFENLREFLTKEGDAEYVTVAGKLGMSPQAVRVLVFRLRRRFRSLLRVEIAQRFQV